MSLAAKLQAAIDAARDLARAAQAGATSNQLDALAGQVIQHTGAFRAALRSDIVHWRSKLPEMDYDGAACLASDGEVTTDPAKVTCPKCRADVDCPIEGP